MHSAGMRWKSGSAALVLALAAVTSLRPSYGANSYAGRWKRQSCRATQFQCVSGQCIPQFLICDGEVNCADGSDETAKACENIVCPSFAFRCDYGACVEGDRKCNGEKNCADGSDEKDCNVPVTTESHSSCKNQFSCTSGMCIDPFLLCDGSPDCNDGSDETKEMCANFSCPSFAFQCHYGACIDKDALCNGIVQCADGSDESPQSCGPTDTTAPLAVHTTSTTTKAPPVSGCALPPQPESGQYKLGGCEPPACTPVPGNRVRTAFLLYSCDAGYELMGSPIVLCDNVWTTPFPKCSKVTCAPLMDPSRDIDCKLNEEVVDCNKRITPGTKASVRCNTYYKHGPEFSTFDTICQPNGQWSREVTSCVPRCGEANPEGVPFISHGVKAKFGEYPWHAGLYRPVEGSLKQACGGSIISERIIITAAHCFWDDGTSQKIDFKQYRVVVGKYYLDWNNRTKHVQSPEIDHVVLHEHFKGLQRRYENDIALITLKGVIQMTQAVRPICIDFDRDFLNHFTPGTNGVVVGWGITETMTQSETVHTATLPYVDFHVCEREVPESFQSFLTYDKFCAGYRNGTSVCPGDSGGGYATQFRDYKWYLVGIVSVGVPSTNADRCNIQQYTTFTRVSEHYDFIRKNKGL